MLYSDLTPYSYLMDEGLLRLEDDTTPENLLKELNVGWLDDTHPFNIGDVSEEFVDALFDLCLNPSNQMRGFHVCPFCSTPPSSPMRIKRGGQEMVIDVPQHMFMERGGRKAWLGSAEIRVSGKDGIIYAAPTMVYHYVAAHNYLPPDEFIQAVLSSTAAETSSG